MSSIAASAGGCTMDFANARASGYLVARLVRHSDVGQAIGLPPMMTLFAFIGVAVTSAAIVLFGEAIAWFVTLAISFSLDLLLTARPGSSRVVVREGLP